jgi:hypothetical protein
MSSTRGAICAIKLLMFGKVLLSIVMAGALYAGTVRLPAPTCILSNPRSEEACQPACCANKTCCETSQSRTSAPSQPFAKDGATSLLAAVIPSVSIGAMPLVPVDRVQFSLGQPVANSPPRLALFCTFLI